MGHRPIPDLHRQTQRHSQRPQPRRRPRIHSPPHRPGNRRKPGNRPPRKRTLQLPNPIAHEMDRPGIHRGMYKNPVSPPNVINPPENITDSPRSIRSPPIYITNRPFYITRTKPHLPKRNRANRPILNSFWLSRFYNFCRCTNAISPTQIEVTGSNALPTNKFDKIANIAPSQNCSTWNN